MIHARHRRSDELARQAYSATCGFQRDGFVRHLDVLIHHQHPHALLVGQAALRSDARLLEHARTTV